MYKMINLNLNTNNCQRRNHTLTTPRDKAKPKASEVLTTYLKQCGEPPWTSFFLKVSIRCEN